MTAMATSSPSRDAADSNAPQVMEEALHRPSSPKTQHAPVPPAPRVRGWRWEWRSAYVHQRCGYNKKMQQRGGEQRSRRQASLLQTIRGQGAAVGSKFSQENIKVNDTLTRYVQELERQRRDRTRLLLDPRTTPWLPIFDVFSTLGLLFVALVTPFEVGFLAEPTSAAEPLFILNRMIDAVFIVDLVLQFFLVMSVSDPDRGTRWIEDHHVIVKHYACGWFPLDLGSILVSAFDVIPLVVTESNLSQLKFLRVMRVLR
jgi:hypothetical protein